MWENKCRVTQGTAHGQTSASYCEQYVKVSTLINKIETLSKTAAFFFKGPHDLTKETTETTMGDTVHVRQHLSALFLSNHSNISLN